MRSAPLIDRIVAVVQQRLDQELWPDSEAIRHRAIASLKAQDLYLDHAPTLEVLLKYRLPEIEADIQQARLVALRKPPGRPRKDLRTLIHHGAFVNLHRKGPGVTETRKKAGGQLGTSKDCVEKAWQTLDALGFLPEIEPLLEELYINPQSVDIDAVRRVLDRLIAVGKSRPTRRVNSENPNAFSAHSVRA